MCVQDIPRHQKNSSGNSSCKISFTPMNQNLQMKMFSIFKILRYNQKKNNLLIIFAPNRIFS